MRTIKKQIPDLEEAIRSGKRFTMYSPGLRFGSGVLFGVFLIQLIYFMSAGPPDGSVLGLWQWLVVMGDVLIPLGVLVGWSTWMTVRRDEIHVVNALTQVRIPWESLTAAEGGGLTLNLKTADHTFHVAAVSVQNVERGGVTRADRIGQIIQAEIDRRKTDRPADQPVPVVKRRIRLHPWLWLSLLALDAILYVMIVQLGWSGFAHR